LVDPHDGGCYRAALFKPFGFADNHSANKRAGYAALKV